MIENTRCIYKNLPTTVKGFTKYNAEEDFYTIVLNARCSHYQHILTYKHELNHIIRGDFFVEDPDVDALEIKAHNL